MHTSIHLCIHTYVHTYVHTYIHAYIHARTVLRVPPRTIHHWMTQIGLISPSAKNLPKYITYFKRDAQFRPVSKPLCILNALCILILNSRCPSLLPPARLLILPPPAQPSWQPGLSNIGHSTSSPHLPEPAIRFGTRTPWQWRCDPLLW
jgi:hypothetical protein